MQLDGYIFQKNALVKSPIYTLYIATKNNKKYKAKIFKKNQIEKYKIADIIQYNTEVFWYINNSQHLLALVEISVYQSGEIHYYQYYQQNLKDYIKYHIIRQDQAIRILKDMMQSVFELIQEGYFPRNLRPQHFVRVNNKWKISSLVYQQQYEKYKGLQCQYVWDSKYQVPEAYKNSKLSQSQLDESIVWNLGSITVNMLLSSNMFMNYQKIKQLTKKGFLLQRSNIKILPELLTKMLCFDQNNRMKLKQLFSWPLFQKQFNIKTLQHCIKQKQTSMITKNVESRQKSKFSRMQMKEKSKVQKSMIQQKQFQKVILEQKQQEILDLYNPLSTKEQFYAFTSKIELVSTFKKNKVAQMQVIEQEKSENNKNEQKFKNDYVFYEEALPCFSMIQKPKIYQNQQSNIFFDIDDLEQISINEQTQNENQNQNQQTELNNRPKEEELSPADLLKILDKYKQEMDKCDFLEYVSQLTSKIPFQKNVKQLETLTQFILLFCSIHYLYPLLKSLNKNQNHFKIDTTHFTLFSESTNFTNIKKICNQSFDKKIEKLNVMKKDILHIKLDTLEFSHTKPIKSIISCDPKQIDFNKQLKIPYRLILVNAYKIINIKQKQEIKKLKEKNSELKKLCGYYFFALAIDKIFIPEDIQDNFKQYYKWRKIPSGSPILLNEIKDYIENSSYQFIVHQANYLFNKYYQT